MQGSIAFAQRRRALGFLLILVSTCWPLSAFAHDGDGLGVAVLGLLGGLVVGVCVVVFLPVRGLAKALLFLPIMGVFCVMGLGMAFAVDQAAKNRSNAAYVKAKENEKAQALRRAGLRQMACEGDDATLGQYLQINAITENGTTILEVIRECVVPPMEAPYQLKRPLGFPLLARELYKRRSDAGENQNKDSYCALLDELHGKKMGEHLRSLRMAQLPIFCSAGPDTRWLRALSGPQPADPVGRWAQWDWLMYLQSEGVDFNAPLPPGEPTLLDRVAECGEPRLIRLALESGDLGAVIPDGAPEREAPALWAVRRFTHPHGCALSAYTGEGERNDIAFINDRMPSLRTTIVNRRYAGNGQSLLWEVGQAVRAPEGDGGAALFAYLMARGANPAQVDGNGLTFMHGIKISPQLKTELDKLSDEEIRKIATAGSKPLLAYSREMKDTDVVSYLCGRKVNGC